MNHIEFAAAESAALEPTSWELWCEAVEAALGHDLDGAEDEHGYSMDGAFTAWEGGSTAEDYVERVKGQAHYAVRVYANGTGFPH